MHLLPFFTYFLMWLNLFQVFYNICQMINLSTGITLSTVQWVNRLYSISLSLSLYVSEKKRKIGFLTYHIFGTPWPRNLNFFMVSCLPQDVPKKISSFCGIRNMVFQRPENGDFGHFIHIVCYISWQVWKCEISCSSDMSFLSCIWVV